MAKSNGTKYRQITRENVGRIDDEPSRKLCVVFLDALEQLPTASDRIDKWMRKEGKLPPGTGVRLVIGYGKISLQLYHLSGAGELSFAEEPEDPLSFT